MEDNSETNRKSKKTKCNLLHVLCCCFHKPEHNIKGENDKKNKTLKTKKSKCKFWKRVRNWLYKPARSETEVPTFDIIENDINIDNNETPKIEDNVTVLRTTINNNSNNLVNRSNANRSLIYKSIFEGNVTVHKTTIYKNEDKKRNENKPCTNSLDIELEKSLSHRTNRMDLITNKDKKKSLKNEDSFIVRHLNLYFNTLILLLLFLILFLFYFFNN